MRVRAIALVVVTAAVAVVGLTVFMWPARWDHVKTGMSRSEVTALVGQPDQDTNEIKGCFWFRKRPLVRYELNVFFDAQERVTMFGVARSIGTAETYHRSVLRLSSPDSSGKRVSVKQAVRRHVADAT